VQRVIRQDQAYLWFQLSFFLSGSAFFMSTHVVLLLVRDRFEFGALELSLWLFVIPQLLLALGSPTWGRILDRIGIVRCRLLISVLVTAYLASYFTGIFTGIPVLIWLASVLQGMSNGGGQLTWALASSHFAPRTEDVPVYNGIHFVLNGIRGLVLPWVGSMLLVLTGPLAVLAATLVSVASIPAVWRSLHWEQGQEDDSVLRVGVAPAAEKAAG
jgi:MFS family permease